MVLLLLGAGIWGESVRPPLSPAAFASERVEQTIGQLAGLPAEDCLQSLRSEHVVPPGRESAEGAPVAASELAQLPDEHFEYLAAPRAPPAGPQKVSRAHRSRGPPIDMI